MSTPTSVSTPRDKKFAHFDLPPGLPRPDLAVETRPASVSSPLPPVVVVAMLAERLKTCLRHTLRSGTHNVPLLPLCCRRGDFWFRLLLRYDVIKKLEQIFEVFQFSIIFLAEALELRGILVADRRVELGQSVLRGCFTWGSTLRTSVREPPITNPHSPTDCTL